MESCGVLLDNSIIITHCLKQRCPGFSSEFIDFLERNPKLGLITTRIEQRILKRLRKAKKTENQGHYRFGELKLFLKKEEVDESKYRKNSKTVRYFFYELKNRKMYLYNPFSNLGLEDMERLTEAICIKPSYDTLFFASVDRDFVYPATSRKIEDKFQIK